jgi:tetratricopeptide (TPR) repeat protein
MAWLIGLVVVALVLLLLFLALPLREWQSLLGRLRELVTRARRAPARVKRPPGPPPEKDQAQPPPAPRWRVLRDRLRAALARLGPAEPPQGERAPRPSPPAEPPQEEQAPRVSSPVEGEDSWQASRGRPAMERMIEATGGAETPVPVKKEPARHRVSLSEFRGWLVVLFIAALLVAAVITLIPQAANVVPRTHRFTIAVADLRPQDLPGNEPAAAASEELRTYLRQAMNRAAMTDTVEIWPVRTAPADAGTAYALARANNADMLVWGEVQEGAVPHYALTLTVIPRFYSEVPEFEEYLQVMVTPPQFAMNRPGTGSLAQDDVSTALAWLVHFYRGEFEQIEKQDPTQFQARPLSADLFNFHWAGLLWFRGDYTAAQDLYARLAGQGYTAEIGPGPAAVCAPTVPKVLCAAALNNQATVILTREARGEVTPDTSNQAISLLMQARQAAGVVTYWQASSLEEARELFAQAARAIPGSLIVQYNLGRAYLARRKWPQAAEALQVFDNPRTQDGRILAALSEAYLGTGDAGNAERTARRAVEVNSGLAEGHLARGRYWLGMGNFDEAGKELDQALALAENEGKRRRSHEVAVGTGPQPNPRRAAYLGAWAQRNDPLIARVHLVQGNRYLLAGQFTANPDVIQYLWNLLTGAPNPYDQSQQEISQTLAIRPNWYDVWYLQGDLAFVRGNYDGAIRAFQQAQQLDRADVESYQALATTFLAKNQPDQAQVQYGALVDGGIAPAQGHFGLGEMARKAGDWEQARAEYQQAVQLDPGYALAYLQLGVVELELGDEAAAKGHFDLAVEHSGLQRWIYLAACVKQGEVTLEQYLRSKWEGSPQPQLLDKAAQEFRRGQEGASGPEFSLQVDGVVIKTALPLRQYYALRLLSGLGRVAYERKNYAEAENRFRQVLQQDPANLDALYGEGRVLLAREDSGAAVGYLESAVTVGPSSIAVQYHLGMAYYAQLRFGSARACFEKVNQLCQEQENEKRRRVDDLEGCQQAPLRLQQLNSGSPPPP